MVGSAAINHTYVSHHSHSRDASVSPEAVFMVGAVSAATCGVGPQERCLARGPVSAGGAVHRSSTVVDARRNECAFAATPLPRCWWLLLRGEWEVRSCTSDSPGSWLASVSPGDGPSRSGSGTERNLCTS